MRSNGSNKSDRARFINRSAIFARLPLGESLATAIVIMLCTSAACAQSSRPAGEADVDPAATSPTTTVRMNRDVGLVPPKRPPLLREGSYLTGVRGTVRMDKLSGWWRLEVEPEQADHPPFSLILLPNSKLQEIEQIVLTAPEVDGLFEISGQTFVYRGRNFLLATHAPSLVEYRPPVSTTTTEPSADSGRGDSVDDIMRELTRAVGPLLQSSGARAKSADDADDAPVTMMTEGTRIVARRGALRRSAGGSWLFVFDADAEGLADPPLIIMPCLLLERMERYARSRADHAPMLLSGVVQRFGDRNYILPTVFQIPRERTVLKP